MLWSKVSVIRNLCPSGVFKGSGRDPPSCFFILSSLTGSASGTWGCSERDGTRRMLDVFLKLMIWSFFVAEQNTLAHDIRMR